MVDALRALIPVLLILAAGLAGCLGGDDVDNGGPGEDPDELKPIKDDGKPFMAAQTTNLERFFEAVQIVPEDDPEFARPNMTARDWLLLSVPLSEQGTVQGFAWQVPEGGLIAGDGYSILLLDIAVAALPMGYPAGLPEDLDWTLALVTKGSDGQGAIGAVVGDFMFGVTKLRSIDGGSPQTVTPRTESFSLRAGYDGLKPGDTVWFVLAARGRAGEEFAVGISMLGQAYQDLGQHQPATIGWEDFHKSVNFRKPLVPERKLAGEGLHIGWLQERHVIGESSQVEISKDLGELGELLPTDLYPHVTLRDVTVSSVTDKAGFGIARAHYTSGGEPGNWRVEGQLHGVSFSESGPFFNSAALPDLVQGRDEGVGFIARGSGSSGASIDWQRQKAGTVYYESLDFLHLSVNMQLADLTGMAHLDHATTYGSLLPD
jgi:hypothetical protein